MRRWLLPLVLGSSFFLGSWGAGCKSGGGTGGAGGDQGIPALADVVYEGGTTDEALQALLDAMPTSPPQLVANFTAPTNGAVVPSSPAPQFTWAVGAKATFDSPRHFIDPMNVDTAPRFAKSTSPGVVGVILSGLLSGVPEAYAHGTPTSGPAYYVLFTTSKNDKLLRVFTPNLTYTPDATALAKLKGAGEAIHAIVTYAEFDQNRIAQDGGPYKGSEIVFTLQ